MNLIFEIREELTHNADEKTKDTAARFFKEGINCYKSSSCHKDSRQVLQTNKERKKDTIFSSSEELLKSDLF